MWEKRMHFYNKTPSGKLNNSIWMYQTSRAKEWSTVTYLPRRGVSKHLSVKTDSLWQGQVLSGVQARLTDRRNAHDLEGCGSAADEPGPQASTPVTFGKFWNVNDWTVKQIINDSNLVSDFSHHVSFIQTSCMDEQCITQKYKGKKILVLHYTFSKIYTE